MLAFVERIGRRTYKHTTPPAKRARKPLIQAAFKRLNANTPAVENKRFLQRVQSNPPTLSHSWERGRLWRIYRQSPYVKIHGDNDCFGTFCLKVAMEII